VAEGAAEVEAVAVREEGFEDDPVGAQFGGDRWRGVGIQAVGQRKLRFEFGDERGGGGGINEEEFHRRRGGDFRPD
jgi:hypothetical protein